MSDVSKVLLKDEEWKNPQGVNFQLCLRCEADPDILTSSQSIGVLNGTSVCRDHFDTFLENQPQYFAVGPVMLTPPR